MLRVALLALVLTASLCQLGAHEEAMMRAGLKNILISTEWKPICEHVVKHWRDMTGDQINTQNKFLENALKLGEGYYGDARKMEAAAHEMHNFVATYASSMPGSTLSIISAKSKALHRLAASLDQTKSVGDQL